MSDKHCALNALVVECRDTKTHCVSAIMFAYMDK